MKKALIISAILIVLVGTASFYGGMKYQESKTPKGFTARNFQNLKNGNGPNGQSGSNFLNGEIISKDDKSITVKLPARQNFAGQNLGGQDGGSKIIFYSDTTEISKFVAGAANDLEIGKSVTINGTTNQDGSLTAQSIQLRPATPNQQ